jgi:uncharacterized protein with PQ loop repeat
MITTVLGLAAAAGVAIWAVPQMIKVYRTPRLQGFSFWGWVALATAVTAIMIQLVLAGVWIMAGAQALNTLAVYYNLWAIWRKS